jgi:integrase
MMADAEKLTGMRTPFEVLAGATLTLRIELQIDGQETAVGCASSISKEFLESLRRQGRIARRILNIAMLERGVFYGRPSAKRGKKRQPHILVPPRLLAHLRRWRRMGQKNLIEFNGAPIRSIDKAFAANVDAAGLGAEVVIHTLRHTAITWLAIEGVDVYEILRFGGITMEVFENVCAHHHPTI